jgi:hypothetical protein
LVGTTAAEGLMLLPSVRWKEIAVIRSRTAVMTGPPAACAVEIDERLAALGYARSTRKEVEVAAAALSEWLHEVRARPTSRKP